MAPKPHSEQVEQIGDALSRGQSLAYEHRSEWVGVMQEAEVAFGGLVEQLEALVTLVRVGFLVTVNGEKGRTDVVNDPELRKLLFTILQAKDTAAAISAVASSPASEPEARNLDGTNHWTPHDDPQGIGR